MLDEQYKDAKARMKAIVKRLNGDLTKVRTGRASLNMFDGVMVEYYGNPTPLNQVAGLANPEPSLITVQPWEQHIIGDVERAILAANLGVTPGNDGSVIRINIPPLTEERRKEYAKQAHKHGETAKNAIRGVRRDLNDALKKLEKDKDISQDELRRGLDEIQKITDQFSKDVDDQVAAKEKEIMTL